MFMCKKSLFSLLCFLYCSIACNAQQSCTVHEWGTFTTLSGSTGILLPGLYKEEEQLPSFVHSQSGFSPDPVTQKGIYKPCYHAKVKMETPVLYFYASDTTSASVKVKFPGGTISQWYPGRSSGEALNSDTAFDFSKTYNGWIQWNLKILAP